MVETLRKNVIKSLFVSICIASALSAGGDEELFLRGNKYYAQKDYDNALHTYDMISKKGRAVFYNMGNCFFRKEDYSRALVCWSRAEIGATPHEYNVIKRNKSLVLKKLGKHKEQSLWYKVFESLYVIMPYISLLLLQLLFLVCWWFFIFVMCKKQTGIRKVARSVVCVFIVFFATMLGVRYTQEKDNQAIVIKKEAMLFAGPDKSFHQLSPIAYADSARVKEAREGWYKIQYAYMIGWVEADVIQII